MELVSPDSARYEEYWGATADSYPYYPTIRHRRRYIGQVIQKKFKQTKNKDGFTVFDFGCGEGQLLAFIKENLGLREDALSGNDLSEVAISKCRQRLATASLYQGVLIPISTKFDVITCSEVIEHTPEYMMIIQWIKNHLKTDGISVITTQAGRIHASDQFAGHTQHFKKEKLTAEMRSLGLKVIQSRSWGFPFFTLQKYLTNFNFNRIRNEYVEGKMTLKKRIVFALAYYIYFLQGWIPFGPQIYFTIGLS